MSGLHAEFLKLSYDFIAHLGKRRQDYDNNKNPRLAEDLDQMELFYDMVESLIRKHSELEHMEKIGLMIDNKLLTRKATLMAKDNEFLMKELNKADTAAFSAYMKKFTKAVKKNIDESKGQD